MPRPIRTKRQQQLEEDYESILNKRRRLESTDHQDPDEFELNADFDYDGEENLQNEVHMDLMVQRTH
jgi:hypothetical protein